MIPRKLGRLGGWLALVLLAAVIAARASYIADLSAFLPARPTPAQRLLVDQLRAGPASRLILIALQGGDAATRAHLEKRVSPHLMRHSYASHLVEAGADLRTVQLLLGHVKLEHTVIYLHLSQRHLQAIANPLDAMPVSGTDTVRRTRRLHKR